MRSGRLHHRFPKIDRPARHRPVLVVRPPQPRLQPSVVCLDRIVRMLLNGVQGRGNQFAGHSRVDRCAVCRDLDRDRPCAQRPGEEAPGGGQVAPQRQKDIDDWAMLIDCPVEISPLTGDLYLGLVDEPPVPGAWRQGLAASMNSGVNRCTHR